MPVAVLHALLCAAHAARLPVLARRLCRLLFVTCVDSEFAAVDCKVFALQCPQMDCR